MVEEKWAAIRSALVEAEKEVLGQEGRQHIDWFRESSEILEPLFKRRNLLYTKWLSSGCVVGHRKYLKARQDACKAVRDAKDTWFKRKVDEAQVSRFGGKQVWRYFRDMQRACKGLALQRTGNIKDEEEHHCTSSKAKEQRQSTCMIMSHYLDTPTYGITYGTTLKMYGKRQPR